MRSTRAKLARQVLPLLTASCFVALWTFCSARVLSNGGVAVVTSASHLHGALATTKPKIDKIRVNGSIFVDSLSFLPTITLNRSVTLTGGTRQTAVQIEPREVPLLLLDQSSAAVLIIANFTFLLSSAADTVEALVGTLVTTTELRIPPAVVALEDVTFAVGVSAWVHLREDIRRIASLRGLGTTVEQVDNALIVGDFWVGPTMHLRNVAFRRLSYEEGQASLSTTRLRVGNGKRLWDAFVNAETPGPPLEVFLKKTMSIKPKDLNGGGPVSLNRKLILSGALDGNTALNVSLDLAGGALAHVTRFGQLVLANLKQDLTSLPPALEDCSGEMCIRGLAYHSAVTYATTGCGCAVTLINTTVLASCGYMDGLRRALQMPSQKTGLQQARVDASSDDTTLKVISFLGRGMCFMNATLLCSRERAPPPKTEVSVEREISPPAKDVEDDDLQISVLSQETGTEEEATGVTEASSAVGSESSDGGSSSKVTSTHILLVVGVGLILLFLVGLILPLRRLRRGRCGGGKSGEDVGGFRSLGVSSGSPFEMRPSPVTGQASRSTNMSREPDFETEVREKMSCEQLGNVDDAMELETELATGGYGVVYKGKWRGIPVAIKTVVFSDSPSKTYKGRERAIIEAAISSSVAHKNVVQTYHHSFKRLEPTATANEPCNVKGDVKVDWKLYIVQELCGRGSLRDALKQGLFSHCTTHKMLLDGVLQIATDVASGMAHLHRHNVVHGDLNTKNVLLQQEMSRPGVLQVVSKLADFGLSVKMDMFQSHVSDHRAGVRHWQFLSWAESCICQGLGLNGWSYQGSARGPVLQVDMALQESCVEMIQSAEQHHYFSLLLISHLELCIITIEESCGIQWLSWINGCPWSTIALVIIVTGI